MKGEFYKMDYEAWDEGTDELTLEQEAAYLRLCHQLYRRKASIPSTPATLGRIWRCHPNKAKKLLADLIGAGKIVEKDGHLSNTRVTRELDDRETRRTQQSDAGHIGGIRSGDNRRKSLKLNDRDAADASSAAKQNEAEREKEGEKKVQIEATPPSVAQTGGDFPPRAFDLWWEKQPNKVAKDAARPAFERVRKSGRASFAELMAGLERYIASKPPTRDWCHPSTWLNQGRWADEPAPEAKARAVPVFERGNGFGHLAAQKRAARLSEDAHDHATERHTDRTVRTSDPRTAGTPDGDARGGYGDGPGQILDLAARRAYG